QQGALLPISKIDAIRSVDGVRAAFPAYRIPVRPGSSFTFGGPPEAIVNGISEEAALSQPRITVAQGRGLISGRSGDVVLGSTVATDLKKKVGDTVDLPVKPADAPPDFASHPFTVVGILRETGTGPDSNAYVDDVDARLLLADTLPPAFRNNLDLTGFAPGFTVYGEPGATIARLDAIAKRINASVPGVKAAKPSVAVLGFRQFVSTFTAITTAAALLALIIFGLAA